jgi:hypothetical protein
VRAAPASGLFYLPAFVTQTIARTFPGCSPSPKHRAGVCVGCIDSNPHHTGIKEQSRFSVTSKWRFRFPQSYPENTPFSGLFLQMPGGDGNIFVPRRETLPSAVQATYGRELDLLGVRPFNLLTCAPKQHGTGFGPHS